MDRLWTGLRARWRPLAAAALLLAAGAGIYSRRDWAVYWALQRRGLPSEGWVTATEPLGPGTVGYAFYAGRVLKTGVSEPRRAGLDPAEYRVGDRVVVYYLPERPSVSVLGEPRDYLRGQEMLLIWALLVFVPFTLWALAREIRRAG